MKANFICFAIAALGCLPAVGQAADFNADGRDDLAFHAPGSSWDFVTTLLSLGSSGWSPRQQHQLRWANRDARSVATEGDFDGNGTTDFVIHTPGSYGYYLRFFFSTGDGRWTQRFLHDQGWANQAGVVAIGGDFNNDGRGDIAFHRPGSHWATVPVFLSDPSGSWTTHNHPAPSWANQAGVVAVGGDFNNDGRDDIAFHRPGSSWATVPVLFSNGNGTWTAHNRNAPSWANQPGVVAIRGDFNADDRADIAFHRPGSYWQTVPLLQAVGNGTWRSYNNAAPSWANQRYVVALPGDFDNDGRTDIAFHKPVANSGWQTIPVILSAGNGQWTGYNQSSSLQAHEPGVVGRVGRYFGPGLGDMLAFYRPTAATPKWSSVAVARLYRNRFIFHNLAAPQHVHQPGVVALF